MALAFALALAYHPDEKTNECFIFEYIDVDFYREN